MTMQTHAADPKFWFDPSTLTVHQNYVWLLDMSHNTRLGLYQALHQHLKELEHFSLSTKHDDDTHSDGFDNFLAISPQLVGYVAAGQTAIAAAEKLVADAETYAQKLRTLRVELRKLFPETRFGFEPTMDKPFETYTIGELSANNQDVKVARAGWYVYQDEGTWRTK